MKYEIFDARNTNLLSDNSGVVEAKTPRQALQSYLNNRGEGDTNFHNTADNDVVWRTTPFIERDSRKYQVGRVSWWGIKPRVVKE